MNHPDLTNRVDRILSKSFAVESLSPLEDNYGHGTKVAGIIGAQGNNSIGISGVCWDVNLVSLKVTDNNNIYHGTAIVSAIVYAQSKEIPILNFSAGSNELTEEMKAIVQEITNYSGLFICSAGNAGANNDVSFHYPSNYKLNNLISVAASTSTDMRKSVSNYGEKTVDIFAPGANIVTTYPISLCGGKINVVHIIMEMV